MVASDQADSTSASSPSTATASASPLRLALTCPKCGVSGWIKWTSLQRGIHCPKCRCEFLIGRTGQIHEMRDLPQTRYTCPRCGKSGSIPATFVVQKSECTDCKLPLVAGPDQRLHGVKEAAALHKSAQAQARDQSYRRWLESNFRHNDGRLRLTHAGAAVATIAAALTVATLGILAWFDSSPETMARRFTQRCLAGEFEQAAGYVGSDDVQRVEFERWQIRHFTSIIDKFRPAGDRVSINVQPLATETEKRSFRVELRSDFLGQRTIEQTWHLQEGQWQFDASATLNEGDALANRPVAGRDAGRGPANAER